jgi:2-oxoglutarate ferredoxin oxidoreductase subunit delta
MSDKEESPPEEKKSTKVNSSEKVGESAKKGKRKDPVVIYRKWCKSCSICVHFCPKKVFDVGADGIPIVARGEDCTQCAICWTHCPDLAITSTEK